MDSNEKETVDYMLNIVVFFENIPTKGLKSARMEDVIKVLPNLTQKTRNPTLPTIENMENSYEEVSNDDLEGQGIEKIVIPSNRNDTYIRIQISLGLKLSVHSDILTEASNLKDEIKRWGGKQNGEQYRKALDKFATQ